MLRFLKTITYKPGYKLTAWTEDEGTYDRQITLNMAVPVPDSTREDQKPVSIVFTQRISLDYLLNGGPDHTLHFVKSFFMAWEQHEMQEWFRVDGRMVDDPHKHDRI